MVPEQRRSRREERKEETRAELIAAAGKVFAERGFHGASLDQIAAEAGYTTGAIYANFAGKEDLFLAVLAATDDNIAVTPGRSVAERNRASLTAIRDAAEDRRRVAAELETIAFALRNDRAREALSSRHANALNRAAEEHWPERAISANRYLSLVQIVFDGLIVRCALDPHVADSGLPEACMAMLSDARQATLGSSTARSRPTTRR